MVPALAHLTSFRLVIWFAALLPGLVILHHAVYLASTRRRQFRHALGERDSARADLLEQLYFGAAPLAVRYVLPAILVSALTALALTALTNPGCYLPWLYTPSSTGVAPTFSSICTPESLVTTVSPRWPADWGRQMLTGASLGFLGAYLYLLILLTDRARRRDVTTGIAIWAAAMPVLGTVMGALTALFVVSGTGDPAGSFSRYAVFFVAGMLPRQFALFVQKTVSRMFPDAVEVTTRTLPLTVLRGVGPDVAVRLEEEGLADVSSLAYASPHQLLRSTTYTARQIVDWIDEALLTVNLPSHWEALERLGVTGAMDLAWYATVPESLPVLAEELKVNPVLLRHVVDRLAQDAQVQDLYDLYWDHSRAPQPLLTPPPGEAGTGVADPTSTVRRGA